MENCSNRLANGYARKCTNYRLFGSIRQAGKPVFRLLGRLFLPVLTVRPRKDKRGVDLISDRLPFGRLWYDKVDDVIGYREIL
jgi:hypothetical protein